MFGYFRAWRLGSHQSVAYTVAAGTIATAIGAGTNKVRVVTTTAAFIKIGSSSTATASDVYLPADREGFFTINPGEKVSAIRVTNDGTLHVTEVS